MSLLANFEVVVNVSLDANRPVDPAEKIATATLPLAMVWLVFQLLTLHEMISPAQS